MARSRAMVGAVALAAVQLCACGKSPEALEAAAVLRSIDALRNAPPSAIADRLPFVETLEKEPAQGQLARAARDACAKAYRLLEEATALEARTRAELDKPDAIAEGLVADVVLAETKLKESAASMPACEEAQAALRRAFP